MNRSVGASEERLCLHSPSVGMTGAWSATRSEWAPSCWARDVQSKKKDESQATRPLREVP